MTTDRFEDSFRPMPSRLDGEVEQRVELGKRAIPYGVTFLDDYLLGLLPHDLVLLGAPSGLGKTEMALNIATTNAEAGRPTHYFALEAEPRELERRRKFALISKEARRRNLPGHEQLRYRTWILGRCEHVVGELNEWADRKLREGVGTLHTFYRGRNFTVADLGKQIIAIHERTTLIVVDHLHYVDTREDENENRAVGDTVKTIRDISLRIGRPIILVVHLRKKDRKERSIMPELDDVHGTSNITKIATQAIFIEHALDVEAPKWWLSPTYMAIRKDRMEGAPRFVALTMFNKLARAYTDTYTLGRLRGSTKWAAIEAGEQPPEWAEHHRPLPGSEPIATPAPTEVD